MLFDSGYLCRFEAETMAVQEVTALQMRLVGLDKVFEVCFAEIFYGRI